MSDVASQALTAEQLDTLIAKLGGQDKALQLVAGELDVQLLTAGSTDVERFATVPAGVAFEERVARGHYGWRNDKLTEEAFPVTQDQFGDLELKLFHFNRSLSSDQAIQEIRDSGYKPAETGDLLAFGEAFPDVQRRHPVIGLGRVVDIDGSLSVPALWFDGDRRTLDLIWFDGDWHRNYRFLGVRPRGR